MSVMHINPAEAVRLSNQLTITDVDAARDFAMEYYKEHPFDIIDPEYNVAICYATVFNAGRIEGIRSERARKKAVRHE